MLSTVLYTLLQIHDCAGMVQAKFLFSVLTSVMSMCC